MSNPCFISAFSVIHEIGIYPLYRGYLSGVMRAAPANAILFFGYEDAFLTIRMEDSNGKWNRPLF